MQRDIKMKKGVISCRLPNIRSTPRPSLTIMSGLDTPDDERRVFIATVACYLTPLRGADESVL